MKILFLFLLAAAGTLRLEAFQQDSASPNSGEVRGAGYAYHISAPKGWILNISGSVTPGRDAELLPKGSTMSNAPSVMYISTVSRKTKDCETADKRVKADIARAKKELPNISILRGTSLETKDHKKAVVVQFGASQFQGVAYVEEDSSIVMFYLVSKDKRYFDNGLYSLKDLVGSYSFVKSEIERKM